MSRSIYTKAPYGITDNPFATYGMNGDRKTDRKAIGIRIGNTGASSNDIGTDIHDTEPNSEACSGRMPTMAAVDPISALDRRLSGKCSRFVSGFVNKRMPAIEPNESKKLAVYRLYGFRNNTAAREKQ